MNRAILVALGTGTIISSAWAFTAGGAGDDGPVVTQEQYDARLRVIGFERAAHESRCGAVAGFERELCLIEAGTTEFVRLAEAEASYKRTEQAARAAQRARIDARYQVDRAKCGPLGGFKRDKCLVQVHATRGRAMLAAAQPYEVRF